MTEWRFECTLCGACCRRPGVVVLGDDEVERIARYRGQSTYELIMELDLDVRDDGSWWMQMQRTECTFLLNDRCSIEEVKPRQCRSYPFWPEFVENPAAWEAERSECPGIGVGRAWSAAEVREMLDLLDQ